MTMDDEILAAAAAEEVTNTRSIPRIEDAFDAAFVSVPRNAWLSALAVACAFRAEHPADGYSPLLRARLDLLAAQQQLAYLWDRTGSCPCGARRESLRTHPHVIGCPTAAALKETT
jgi:hypothetical protein